MSRSNRPFKMVVTGDKELDKALLEIAGRQETPKHVNAFVRKATRKAAKEIVLPKVRARVPVETGELESHLTVRAKKRSRKSIGYGVTTKDGLFTGDTFYGGFLEFGFKTRGGGFYAPDQWLRIPLYSSEREVRSQVASELRAWIRANRR